VLLKPATFSQSKLVHIVPDSSLNNETCRYHGEGDENHEIVLIEMEEMELAIETTGSDKARTSQSIPPFDR
jgi:hypothetical protein